MTPPHGVRILALGLSVMSLGPLVAQTPNLGDAKFISGTWVLQQAGSLAELESCRSRWLDAALKTPHIRGFCLRVPWKAVDADFALLEAGEKLARERRIEYSIRFMAGRHTPARLFDRGCPSYARSARKNHEPVPVPFHPDGTPNRVFEEEYDRFVARLAAWCREHKVRLLHLAWYGQDWAELNHGREVRALPGYTYENWLTAHTRLLDIALKHAGEDLSVELPFSGYGPCWEPALAFADHVIEKIGPACPLFFCQANGWGPQGDWGAPNRETEARFDQVWEKPICRGQQMIQPQDYDWPLVFAKLYANQATYCEVYAPSFTLQRKALLTDEIRKFAEHCRRLDSS